MSAPERQSDAAANLAGDLDEARIIAWLKQHPDILNHHPELCGILLPPLRDASGDNVTDLQRVMVQRLQGQLARANQVGVALIDAGRQNMTATARVHEAVLLLLDATSFEHMVHIATQDWTDLLDVDVVSLCVEGDPRRALGLSASSVYVLPPGSIDDLLGAGVPHLLREQSGVAPKLYGPAAELVQSDALARLHIGPNMPQVLLALGSREAGKFQPAQGTELLDFVARVLERTIRTWLKLRRL
ncbi:DUF484 family protein [Ferrovibrio sp.]|uniref:DUF484 family protein n=1 Tax=Ferrovibrio sp. TaxID=1917215 RepID=UPI003D146D46